MSTMSTKQQVIQLLWLARREEIALFDGLSPLERSASGTLEQWSAKDMLAHIADKKRRCTQRLVVVARGETPPTWPDKDLLHATNADIFRENCERTWQEIEAEAEKATAALIAQVESMAEEELTDPQRYIWQHGEPLWEEILGKGLLHSMSHLISRYRQRDQLEQAYLLNERIVETIRQVGMPAKFLGSALYNLACYYALDGQIQPALQTLTEALRLRPTLVEWSSKDSDFASLWADPTYQTLYKEFIAAGAPPEGSLIDRESVRTLLASVAPPLIIDVREPSEYAAGSVAGSINLPLGQLPQLLTQLPSDQHIVTYCNMHHRGESRGERASALLREKGYQARTLDGGYPGWQGAGLPVNL